MTRRELLILRWSARATGTLCFLLLGAFFVEHTIEWFRTPTSRPPAGVFLLHGIHLAALCAFALAWRWETLGGFLVLASTTAFFACAAGRNALVFSAITAVPAFLWIAAGIASRRPRTPVP